MIPNTLLHWLTRNERGHDFVVGDIHGHAALLDGLVDCVRFDPVSDRLFKLGDLIDRDPQSQVLLERVRDEPWLHSFRGNYEALLKGALQGLSVGRFWCRDVGDWGHGQPDGEHQQRTEVIDGPPIGMSLPLVHGRRVGLVHTELHDGRTWEDLEQVCSLREDAAVDDTARSLQAASLVCRRSIIWLAGDVGRAVGATPSGACADDHAAAQK